MLVMVSDAAFAADVDPTSREITERLIELMEQGGEAGATPLLKQPADRNLQGSIDVAGRNEDENGKAPSDVVLTVQQTVLGMKSETVASTFRDVTVNGSFTLR